MSIQEKGEDFGKVPNLNLKAENDKLKERIERIELERNAVLAGQEELLRQIEDLESQLQMSANRIEELEEYSAREMDSEKKREKEKLFFAAAIISASDVNKPYTAVNKARELLKLIEELPPIK